MKVLATMKPLALLAVIGLLAQGCASIPSQPASSRRAPASNLETGQWLETARTEAKAESPREELRWGFLRFLVALIHDGNAK